MLQVCFVNTEQEPLETKHVCWHVRDKENNLELVEVVEEFYPHPDAPDIARVSLLVEHVVHEVKKLSVLGTLAGSVHSLWYSMAAVDEITKVK